MKRTMAGGLLVAALTMTGFAQAQLVARNLDGNAATAEAYFDTVLNVTWLADANLPLTQTFGASLPTLDLTGPIPGVMSRDDADMFISAMNAANAGAGYLGVNAWLLPTAPQLGTLYTALTGLAITNLTTPPAGASFAPFQNLPYLQDVGFWSADAIDIGTYCDYACAYRVSFAGAGGNWVDTGFGNRVFAVADGSIGTAVSAVPEPSSALLVFGGLLAAAGIRRRAARA